MLSPCLQQAPNYERRASVVQFCYVQTGMLARHFTRFNGTAHVKTEEDKLNPE